jgi:hypothetical protein
MEKAVCVRDDLGRFAKGASGNPAGRPRVAPERKALTDLLAAAERAGAQVLVLLPERRVPAPAHSPAEAA